MEEKKPISNLIIISDTHCGCRDGLCPPIEIPLDGGSKYLPSDKQKIMWNIWEKQFWGEWVPEVTHGEPFAVVMNGDMIDGVHHGSVSQVSHNLSDQKTIAELVFKPIVEKCAKNEEGKPYFYIIRGTESHVGASATTEEDLGKFLKAKQTKTGEYSHYELWIRIGGALCHLMHHIGYTSSAQHEASAINAELTREITEAARWAEEIPLFIIRSHRHRYARVSLPAQISAKKHVEAIAFCTPGWQLKTSFTYRIAGARISPPQLGGAIIRSGDEDVYARHFTRTIRRRDQVNVEELS